MPFDINKFSQAEIQHFEKDVDVPNLDYFFAEDEQPVWRVRSISGYESAKVNEAAERNAGIADLVVALSSGNGKEKSEAIQKSLGISDDVPTEVAKRIEILMLGSINPECDRDTAIKLATYFPLEFNKLTSEILLLTGQGGDIVGKQKDGLKDQK